PPTDVDVDVDAVTSLHNAAEAGIPQILHPAAVKNHFSVKDLLVKKTNKKKISSPRRQQLLLSGNATFKLPHYSPFGADHHRPTFRRPKLIELVKDHKNNIIIQDVDFLLDFAIIGFAKAGTSTMMEWLGLHNQISCFSGETPHLSKGMVGAFVKRLYNGLDPDPLKLHGYKNPTDIQNLRAIRLLREYFPDSKIFIGIRHPILWFQSFYNHRIQNTGKMPDPKKLAEHCSRDSQGVCGPRAHYHLALSRLGKTNYTLEREAYSQKEWEHLLRDDPVWSPNPVFLYDTQQLADKDPVRKTAFRSDIEAFLGLTTPLDDNPHYSPGKTLNATEQAERDAKKLDICLEKHGKLRKTLLEASQHAAHWIRTYFIHAPDVYISNPDHFQDIMDSYMVDPCG
ncbi:MAG: hypothetical protein SGILL_007380, partial [Bacillariaceae sp.]